MYNFMSHNLGIVILSALLFPFYLRILVLGPSVQIKWVISMSLVMIAREHVGGLHDKLQLVVSTYLKHVWT